MMDQTSRPTMQPETLFRFKFLQSGKFSPDGKRVLYGVSRIDLEKNQETVNLWLLDLETMESRQLTFGDWVDSAPDWSPNGKQIAFRSSREGMPQIFVMPVDGGEAQAITNAETAIAGGPLWSPNGKTIAFTAARKLEDAPKPGEPYRVTRPVYRFDGIGLVDPVVQDIFTIPVEGGESKALVEDECHNSLMGWSPKGDALLYTSDFAPDSLVPFAAQLRWVDLQGKAQQISGDWGMLQAAAWMPDNEGILFCAQPTGLPIGSNSQLWLTDRSGVEPQCKTADFEFGFGGGLQGDSSANAMPALLVSENGQRAWFNAQVGGEVSVYEIALRGEESVKAVVTGERCCAQLDVKNGKLLYAAQTMNRAPDLYLSDTDGGNEQRLTRFNCRMLGEHAKVSVEHLRFPAVDGADLEGWFMKPPKGEAPYPTVLYIHGGPHSAFGYTFSFDFQMLAGAGYGVLFLNQRASTGYGEAFSTAIKGDWGNLDYQDLMSGVDYAIEQGLVDADRLGVCGLSGGGNLSTWIVGQTDRFKAAVPENPVTNWLSMYGVSDVGCWFAVEELGGHPHEIPEIYRKCSPTTYAHNCTTPTLMIQGEQDHRCPPEQSEQFYTVLKANGCITEMLRLPNSPHGGSIAGAPQIRDAQNKALLEWMNRYVLGISSDQE